MRYERNVHAEFSSRYGDGQRPDSIWLPGPWLEFWEQGARRPRWCQPDGILLQPRAGHLVIVEVKLRHIADAYWSLFYLYAPVLACIFPRSVWTRALCEVVRWYDPAEPFPPHIMCADPAKLASGALGVHICAVRK